MKRFGCLVFIICSIFVRLEVHAADDDVWKKIASDVMWAIEEQAKVRKLGAELKAGNISEAKRIQMLKQNVQIFCDQLETLEAKFNAQRIVAEYIDTLSRPQDTELIKPLMAELLDTEDGKRNSTRKPREINYSTAAILGRVIGKTRAYEPLSVSELENKLNSSSGRYANISFKIGLINILAGMDLPVSLQIVYQKVRAQDEEGAGSQSAVDALNVSRRAESVSVLLSHGINHPKNRLTRGKALLGIGKICSSEAKDEDLQDICLRTVFPKLLALIKGLDPVSDQEASGRSSRTMAQVAFESLVDICTDRTNPYIVTACAVLPTLKDEPRIKEQFASYVQLEKLQKNLESLTNALQKQAQAFERLSEALGKEAKAWSDLENAFSNFATKSRVKPR